MSVLDILPAFHGVTNGWKKFIDNITPPPIAVSVSEEMLLPDAPSLNHRVVSRFHCNDLPRCDTPDG